jgi:hypothetical protein
MRFKRFALPLLLLSATTAAQAADALHEDFESATSLPEGWTFTTSDSACKGSFSVDKYSNLADFKTRIPILDECGNNCLVAFTGGYSTMGKVTPDLQLTTAQFTVPENGHATFLYSYNLAYNNASGMAEEDQTILDISVVTENAEDVILFTDVSAGLGKWRKVCLDLSQFAGKSVSLRFRNYNNSMSESLGSLLSQRLYIDNLTVNSETSSDLCLTGAAAFSNGALSEQPATVTVRNYGAPVDSYTLSYRIDDNETVTETVAETLATNESKDYTFTQPAKFANSGNQSVTFSVAADADDFTSNNETSVTANIFPLGALPYKSTSKTLSTDFTSTFSGSSKVAGGWRFYDTLSSWVYTGSAYKAYLYSNSAYTLPAGNYTVSFDYTATGATTSAEVYLFKAVGDYAEPVTTRVLQQEVEEVQNAAFTFNVAEAGDYLFALSMENIESMEQVAVQNIILREADPTPDICVKEIVTPQSNVAAGEYKVSVKVENLGGVAADDITIKYQFADGDAVTATLPAIAAGDNVTFSFPEKLHIDKEPGEYTLTVTATADSDSNTSNDSVSKALTVYTPLSMPWCETFTEDEQIDRWTVVNPDDDSSYWGVTDQYTWYDCNVMLLNAFNSTVHNDWLITPALNINETQARFSFYYGNLNNSEATTRVKIYLTQSTDVEEILNNGALIDEFVPGATSMRYVSEIVTPPAPGTYYLAIFCSEGIETAYISDVRLDTTDEVYITSATISPEEPLMNEPTKVTAHIVNAGLHDLNNVTVSYTSWNSIEYCEIKQEEVIECIPANSEMDYIFENDLVFSIGTPYFTTIRVSHESDSDDHNNFYEINTNVKAIRELPYSVNFDYDYDGYELNGKWEVANLSPYSGEGALSLIGKSEDQTEGDWAFLDLINIPAGTYNLSFFWRTFPGSTGENYERSFSICIGEAGNAEAMTTTLFRIDHALNATEFATKELVPVTIDHDGLYVIGINALSDKAQGRLTLDEIKLAAEPEGEEVGMYDKAYQPKITTGWYHYHPAGAVSQWAANSDNTAMVISEYTDWSGNMKGSYLAAPALRLEAEKRYKVTFDYDVTPYIAVDSTEVTTTDIDKDKNRLDLFISDRDLPSSYDLLTTTASADNGEATIEYTPAQSGNFYFALRPDSSDDATYTLSSFRVEEVDESSVARVAQDAETFRVTGRTITPLDGATITIYDTLGHKVATTSHPITLPRGLYIISSRKLAL